VNPSTLESFCNTFVVSLTMTWGRVPSQSYMPCRGLGRDGWQATALPHESLCCLQLDNAAAYTDRNRLRTIARAQLFHDVLDVNFHCLF